MLSVDESSIVGQMGLSDDAHVQVALILRRLLDNRTDHDGRDAAHAWLDEYWPSVDQYRLAVKRGANPLRVRLAAGQRVLLERARRGECRITSLEYSSAKALQERRLLVRNGHMVRLTDWGKLVADEQANHAEALVQ